MDNRFAKITKGNPIFTCENCGKKTRNTTGNSNTYCNKCFDAFEDENAEADTRRSV